YLDWLGKAVRGDFGTSFQNHLPVGPELVSRLPVTLELAILAFLIANAIAVPLGALAAYHHQQRLDSVISVFATVLGAVPSCWLASASWCWWESSTVTIRCCWPAPSPSPWWSSRPTWWWIWSRRSLIRGRCRSGHGRERAAGAARALLGGSQRCSLAAIPPAADWRLPRGASGPLGDLRRRDFSVFALRHRCRHQTAASQPRALAGHR